jgi:RIO-like serine/threonine protein kinase
MASFGNHIAPENLRLMLLAYGLNHSYRVVSLDEIVHSIPHGQRDEVRNVLEDLAQEGLVTRFSGRYEQKLCYYLMIDLRCSRVILQLYMHEK